MLIFKCPKSGPYSLDYYDEMYPTDIYDWSNDPNDYDCDNDDFHIGDSNRNKQRNKGSGQLNNMTGSYQYGELSCIERSKVQLHTVPVIS